MGIIIDSSALFDIFLKVLAILNTPRLEVTDGHLILMTVCWYTDRKVDFIDAFNAAWMQQQGLETVCTFDRKHFLRLEGIKVLTPTEAAWSPGPGHPR